MVPRGKGVSQLTPSMIRVVLYSRSTFDGVKSPSLLNPKAAAEIAAVNNDCSDNDSLDNSGFERRGNTPDPIRDKPLRDEEPKLTHSSLRIFNKPLELGNSTDRKNLISSSKCPSGFSSEGLNSKDFLESLKLGFDHRSGSNFQGGRRRKAEGEPAVSQPPEPHSTNLQDADEIFKKMKETGLIPNAVAMLDSLCKDGLFQEALKLFGLMREKGSMPEIVIYTAVVDGFCKANELDEAQRIFRKMQNKGISPNAYSFTVLIQGLYMGKKLEDALNFFIEMLEAGHSANVETFTGFVNAYCQEKGVDETQRIIMSLRNKGFCYDEKAIKEHLQKKGPFSPAVWEAIFGTKSPQRPF